jgi:hypothetical protein
MSNSKNGQMASEVDLCIIQILFILGLGSSKLLSGVKHLRHPLYFSPTSLSTEVSACFISS